MHLDGYFSVIWKAVTLLILYKKISLLYIVLYCSQSYSITQSTQTLDNSTQITIPFGTL